MGALTSLATVGLNYAVASQAARRQSQTIDTERDRDVAAIQARDREQAQEERELLARRLAAQRARAGAAGVAGRGGSSEAVLRGLVEDAETEQRFREAESARRIDALQSDAQLARRRNRLELVGDATRSSLRLLGGGSRSRRSLLDG